MNKNLTFFQQLIQNDSKVEVVCQTDSLYSYAANQCSWCSAQFILNRQALLSTFFTDKQKFTEIYSNCIAVGTQLRHQNGQIPCGENADNDKILNLIQKDYKIEKYTYSQNDFILKQMEHLIPPFALQQFNGRKHTQIKQLKIQKQCQFIMFGRHGQTFMIFPLKDNKYLVLAIAQGLQTGVGICKGCRVQGQLIPQNVIIKIFYYFCHAFNAFNLFLFLYQRSDCFGQRNKKFQEEFDFRNRCKLYD